MSLQSAPANTNAYLIAGYAVIFGIMLLYLISLSIRRRHLEQDLALLEEVDQEN